MIVDVTSTLHAALRDVQDLKRFHVEINAPKQAFDEMQTRLSDRITFIDDDNVWISIDWILHLPSAPNDAAWKSAFTAMIEKAKPYAWVNDAGSAIRAHVVWANLGTFDLRR